LGKTLRLGKKEHRHQNEHQNNGQEEDEPSNTGGTCAADEVQDPCPEEDVNCLDNENHGSARDSACVGTNAILVNVANVLVQHDKEGNG
jgi:hypothetical protein